MTSESSSQPKFELRVLKGKIAHDVVFESLARCVDVVREAYMAHDAGRSLNPPSYFLRFPEKPSSRIIALPAYLGDRFDVAGLKWIGSFPDNVDRGFPRASALLILNDYETGYPFAVLESSIISAARTAASAVLAAEALVPEPKRARRLGIVGTGLIARYMYRFLRGTSWQIDDVHVYDRKTSESERFIDQVCEKDAHRQIVVSESAEALVEQSDLVVFTTTAGTPYLNDARVLAHRPVLLNISLRDLGTDLILESHNVVDDVEHVLKADTSPHLTEQRVGNRRFIHATLADVLAGRFRPDRTRPVIFSPFGLGILDLALGKWIYDEARRRGEGTVLDDFFFDLVR